MAALIPSLFALGAGFAVASLAHDLPRALRSYCALCAMLERA
ncbi:hypothetical protein [Novosphingobium sp. KN65.2]|nr:hypothetical protein [Novosphingobium sp. KN65.2]